MGKLRILLANEPRSYREVLAATFQILKPEAEVVVSEPRDLDVEVQRFAPHLVVCSQVTPVVKNEALSWIELYPDFRRVAHVDIDGERSTMEGVELPNLLCVIDQVERMV